MAHGTEMWKTLRWAGVAAGLVAGGYWLVVKPVERAVAGAGMQIERGLQQVLGAVTNRDTRIVEGRAEISESTEVSELALLEMRMSATRTIEKSETMAIVPVPLGTKRLIVRGHYRVKAGYRLTPGVSLRMAQGRPVARFPRAEVLSVELIDYDVLSENDGWLNRIQPADRAQILRELREQMGREAEQSGMLDTVEAMLRTRLRDLMGADHVTIEREIP